MALGKTLRNGTRRDQGGTRAPARSRRNPPGGETAATGGIQDQIAELNRLVQDMLENAEETIAEHPVATVAGRTGARHRHRPPHRALGISDT